MSAAEVERRVREMVAEVGRTSKKIAVVIEMEDATVRGRVAGCSGSGALLKLSGAEVRGTREREARAVGRTEVPVSAIVGIRRGH